MGTIKACNFLNADNPLVARLVRKPRWSRDIAYSVNSLLPCLRPVVDLDMRAFDLYLSAF